MKDTEPVRTAKLSMVKGLTQAYSVCGNIWQSY